MWTATDVASSGNFLCPKRSGLSAGKVNSSLPNLLMHIYMDLATYIVLQSSYNRMGPSLKLLPQNLLARKPPESLDRLWHTDVLCQVYCLENDLTPQRFPLYQMLHLTRSTNVGQTFVGFQMFGRIFCSYFVTLGCLWMESRTKEQREKQDVKPSLLSSYPRIILLLTPMSF